jgi:hypothetical protein
VKFSTMSELLGQTSDYQVLVDADGEADATVLLCECVYVCVRVRESARIFV